MRSPTMRRIGKADALPLSKEKQRSFQNLSSRWPVPSGKADGADRAVFPNRGAKWMFE